MAGSDVAVTDGALADLVLEYAMHLGRAGSTDTVTLPTARSGRAEEASFLLGPASQIALTRNDDPSLDPVELPTVAAVSADLRARIDRLTSRDGFGAEAPDEGVGAFADFDFDGE